MVKNFLIVLKNQQQTQWTLHQKEHFKKTAEATGDLIGNKIVDKITSVSKKPAKELPKNDKTKEEDTEITTHKKRYISPEERQQIIE